MRMNSEVYLRRPVEGDLGELAERYRASRKHLALYANAHFDRERFNRMLKHTGSETDEYFLLCRREDNAIAGNIHLSQIVRGPFQNACLGYQLFSGFTGKGYMTIGVGLTLRFAFKSLKLHRVEANVQPDNMASIAVLKRCGFSYEGFSRQYLKIGGRWRDHERWAIIKENLLRIDQ
jgi:ribosomal-protein-alanine N-acetyltransferase